MALPLFLNARLICQDVARAFNVSNRLFHKVRKNFSLAKAEQQNVSPGQINLNGLYSSVEALVMATRTRSPNNERHDQVVYRYSIIVRRPFARVMHSMRE